MITLQKFCSMALMAALAGSVASAQNWESLAVQTAAAPVPPYALLDLATVTGSGNNITATRVPVVLSGKTVYRDIKLLFDVDSSGNVTLAPNYPLVSTSQSLSVAGFKAGKYVAPSTMFSGTGIINVSGPGITSGGGTAWSLATGSGAFIYTYPATATWYAGPLSSNPLAARIKAAGITSSAWSYGICSYPYSNPNWDTGSLLGFSQNGNTITIVSFSTYGGPSPNSGKDFPQPVDQITFTLAP